MIYISYDKEQGAEARVEIPNNGLPIWPEQGKLQLVSTVEGAEKFVTTRTIADTSSKMYYTISVTLPSGMNKGEYRYELTDIVSGRVLSQGLCYLGDMDALTPTPAATTGSKIEIKQSK